MRIKEVNCRILRRSRWTTTQAETQAHLCTRNPRYPGQYVSYDPVKQQWRHKLKLVLKVELFEWGHRDYLITMRAPYLGRCQTGSAERVEVVVGDLLQLLLRQEFDMCAAESITITPLVRVYISARADADLQGDHSKPTS
jgi:hypothetical protein